MNSKIIIDLRRMLEEEDCNTDVEKLFTEKLNKISEGDRFEIIVSNADAWFTLRNVGDRFGYEVIRYWKNGVRDFRIEAVKKASQ